MPTAKLAAILASGAAALIIAGIVTLNGLDEKESGKKASAC